MREQEERARGVALELIVALRSLLINSAARGRIRSLSRVSMVRCHPLISMRLAERWEDGYLSQSEAREWTVAHTPPVSLTPRESGQWHGLGSAFDRRHHLARRQSDSIRSTAEYKKECTQSITHQIG